MLTISILSFFLSVALLAPENALLNMQLHQFVRKDLLEIFVVPKAASSENDSDSDDEEDSDDDEEEEGNTYSRSSRSSKKKSSNATKPPPRRLVTRRRSIPISNTVTSTNSNAHRHYPGRVGLRCVHCSSVRRASSKTSKAAFYPLRLKNIYREVCAWQRIHFKNCKHVPAGVRERYDHYKQIDTSRGKVRYWETSAKRIGLQNNPNR